MPLMRNVLLGACLMVAGVAFGGTGPSCFGPALASEARPVVVELFTSQGCARCTEAEKVLGALAERPGVIALTLHVDYWDYIGWRDPFADPAATARQRAYERALGRAFVYTPQVVINGTREVPAASLSEVLAAVREAQAAPGPALRIALRAEPDGSVRVHIPGASYPGAADVWLVAYTPRAETVISGGENAGRKLVGRNVVRTLRHLGTWRGEATELVIPATELAGDGAGGCAILVQVADGGPIIGARAIDLAPGS